MNALSHIEKQNLAKRFWLYQQERFPLFGHGPLIAAFTFSAISYSRISRGFNDFIPLGHFLLAFVSALGLFFLLRVSDEFKDAADDLRYRPHLPVPRGLIQLKELGWIGAAVLIGLFLLHMVFMPSMLPLFLLVLVYMVLMFKEFFVEHWLRSRLVLYGLSHMIIIPLVDVYATGFDWFLAGSAAPIGLWCFFLLSFLNGMVLEIGRKIRIEKDEREGVDSYSSRYGPKGATILWLCVLGLTLGAAFLAASFAGYGLQAGIPLGMMALLCAIPALRFLQIPSQVKSQQIEKMAGLWTLSMYLILGGIPMAHYILKQILLILNL